MGRGDDVAIVRGKDGVRRDRHPRADRRPLVESLCELDLVGPLQSEEEPLAGVDPRRVAPGRAVQGVGAGGERGLTVVHIAGESASREREPQHRRHLGLYVLGSGRLAPYRGLVDFPLEEETWVLVVVTPHGCGTATGEERGHGNRGDSHRRGVAVCSNDDPSARIVAASADHHVARVQRAVVANAEIREVRPGDGHHPVPRPRGRLVVEAEGPVHLHENPPAVVLLPLGDDDALLVVDAERVPVGLHHRADKHVAGEVQGAAVTAPLVVERCAGAPERASSVPGDPGIRDRVRGGDGRGPGGRSPAASASELRLHRTRSAEDQVLDHVRAGVGPDSVHVAAPGGRRGPMLDHRRRSRAGDDNTGDVGRADGARGARDGANLGRVRRLVRDADGVAGSAVERGREGEGRSPRGHDDVRLAGRPEGQPNPYQAVHRSTDRELGGDAGHVDVGDVGAPHRARGIRHRAGLHRARRLGENRGGVGLAARHRGGKRVAGGVRQDGGVVGESVLEDQGSFQVGDRAAHRVPVRGAGHLHAGDVAASHRSASSARHRAGL